MICPVIDESSFNLLFLSKVLEKVVARQLNLRFHDNNQLKVFQSGFRNNLNNQTAFLKVSNHIPLASKLFSDVCASFDTLDHNMLHITHI